jgi:hypothetical protein
VTFRFATTGSLRRDAVNKTVRAVLRALSEVRQDFRVTTYSLQGDHLHTTVEGDTVSALEFGLRSLSIRLGKRLNATLSRRGRIFADRHHRRELATPREVRNCYVYVLLNRRKHVEKAGIVCAPERFDRFSSSLWFDGWRDPPSKINDASPVAKPETWLGAVGWRRHGLLA